MTTCILHGIWQTGIPEYAEDGQTVTYSAPSGCVLSRKFDGADERQVITTPSPFVHTGPRAVYNVIGTTEAQSTVMLRIA